jgi:hypothetical protein
MLASAIKQLLFPVSSRTAFIIVYGVGIVGVMSGCAAPDVKMYDGEPQQKNAIAIIKAEDQGVGIKSVDGHLTIGLLESLGRHSVYVGTGTTWARSVEVTAGKHELGIRYDHRNMFSESALWLVAEAGHAYTIKSLPDELEKKIRFWIIDDNTGARTGGVSGSSDEPN